MIAYVKGTLEDVTADSVIIEAGGIGYEVHTTVRFLEQDYTLGTQIKLYTYMQVREDGFSLFGFDDKNELSVFELLIGVSGVGPKVAMSILSALTIDELQMAVMSADAKAIVKANGVGMKGAQRIILDLKDKIDIADVVVSKKKEKGKDKETLDSKKEAALALTSLGFSQSEAMKAVKSVEDSDMMSTEQLISAALRNMNY